MEELERAEKFADLAEKQDDAEVGQDGKHPTPDPGEAQVEEEDIPERAPTAEDNGPAPLRPREEN